MKMSQESIFVGKGSRDCFHQLARVNPREALAKVTHFFSLVFVGCDKLSADTPFLPPICVPALCLSPPTSCPILKQCAAVPFWQQRVAWPITGEILAQAAFRSLI